MEAPALIYDSQASEHELLAFLKSLPLPPREAPPPPNGLDHSGAHPEFDEELWSPPDYDAPPPPELPKANKQRDNVAMELLTTEQTYVSQLQFLMDSIVEPLRIREASGQHVLPKEKFQVLFGGLSEILNVNRVLLNSLELKLAEWSDVQTLGDVFLTTTPYFKMYTAYTRQYDSAMEILEASAKYTPLFSTFISQWESATKEQRRGLDLPSYLILPIQRIPRYKLLLETLLKCTPESHPDYVPLSRALHQVEQVANQINEDIRATQNRKKILEIQNSLMFTTFGQTINLIEPHRLFIKEGTLTKVCRKTCKPRRFFLFNDILVYCAIAPPPLAQYIYHEKIDLDAVYVKDIEVPTNTATSATSSDGASGPTEAGGQYAFVICSPKKSFIVIAKTMEERADWSKALTETANKWTAKRSTLRLDEVSLRSFQNAPVFVPDRLAPQCMQCNTEFTLFFRRHHCRACGEVVCGKCSDKRLKLRNEVKPVRVCNKCYSQAQESTASGRPLSLALDPTEMGDRLRDYIASPKGAITRSVSSSNVVQREPTQ